jgi:hypothetical protein
MHVDFEAHGGGQNAIYALLLKYFTKVAYMAWYMFKKMHISKNRNTCLMESS